MVGLTAQPAALPPTVKSDAVRPVTAFVKLSVKARLVALVDVAGAVKDWTAGGFRSTVTVAALAALVGPALPPRSAKAPAPRDRATVPSPPPTRVTVYLPSASGPSTEPTDQPVAVPSRGSGRRSRAAVVEAG